MRPSHLLQPGEVFAGAYRIERRLGAGAMGAVYLVEELGAAEPRALKVMNAGLTRDARFVQRFVQEAQIGQRIASPHVVASLGSGTDPEYEVPYLVMEYVEGPDLERWRSARPPAGDVRAVLAQLFDAVGAAHAARIVHRDLKPENILVAAREGRPFVKVLDFGVAKLVRDGTLSGTTPGLGSPIWTAPEQGAKGPVGPNADVWALGLIAFYALSGKLFWKSVDDANASQWDLACELLSAPVPPASTRAREIGCEGSLPAGFDAWFARAVVRDASARFRDAREAWAALGPLLAH